MKECNVGSKLLTGRGITSSTLVQCIVIMQTEVKVQKDDNDRFHIDDSL